MISFSLAALTWPAWASAVSPKHQTPNTEQRRCSWLQRPSLPASPASLRFARLRMKRRNSKRAIFLNNPKTPGGEARQTLSFLSPSSSLPSLDVLDISRTPGSKSRARSRCAAYPASIRCVSENVPRDFVPITRLRSSLRPLSPPPRIDGEKGK